MKKFHLYFFAILGMMLSVASCTKDDETVTTKTIDFESVALGDQGFWNGADGSGKFTTDGATFLNSYTVSPTGDYWGGFACSNKGDITTPGYTNQYSSAAGTGAANSSQFGLSYGGSTITFPKAVTLQYAAFVNSTYALIEMKMGGFGKKFGGATGNDEDWFKLTIKGYATEGGTPTTLDIYLADYRFADNTNDYIINQWTSFDLSSLGSVVKVEFSYSSSDNTGEWSNTPSYVCIDNIVYSE
jgi:hypothetical protein